MRYLLLIGLYFFTQISFAQQNVQKTEETGVVSGRIFSEFFTALSGDNKNTGFEVKRAYFGYLKKLEHGFSAEVKIDIGSPNDVSGSSSLKRRFGYFRTAALYYDYQKWRFEFGMIETAQFKISEGAWGKRYIFKTFQDEYKFGPSADLGFKAFYKTGKFDFDAGIYNGEGFSVIQNDKAFKGAIGITAQPLKGTTLRLYGDISNKRANQKTIGFFAGQKIDKLSIGAEYNHMYNVNFVDNQERFGYSLFGRYDLNKWFNIFCRYDNVESNRVNNSPDQWSLSSDGSAIITGVEVRPVKSVKFAANYRDWNSANPAVDNYSALYFNVEVTF